MFKVNQLTGFNSFENGDLVTWTTKNLFGGIGTQTYLERAAVVVKVPAIFLGNQAGTKIQLHIVGTASNSDWLRITVGHAAASGDAWDADAVTTVTKAGGEPWSFSAGTGVYNVSDEIDFAYDGVRALNVAFDLPGSGNLVARWNNYPPIGSESIVSYVKLSTSEAAAADRTSGSWSTQGNTLYGFQKVSIGS